MSVPLYIDIYINKNMPKDSLKTVLKIFQKLKESGIEHELLEPDLKKMIMLYGGLSPITVKAYMDFILAWGLIKPKNLQKKIYTVDWDAIGRIENVQR